MTHYRAEYRAVTRDALSASERFQEFQEKSAWAQNIDPEALPIFGVATPRETSSREGGGTVHRVTTVLVALKRQGGDDLEDILDGDSLEVERILLGVLEPCSHIVALGATDTSINGEGSQRIGTLLMEFLVTRFTDAGETT